MATISIFRELIRSKNYVVSHHAADELEDDDITIIDLESIALTGQIVERQYDGDTDETKHVVSERSIADCEAEAVVKIGFSGELRSIVLVGDRRTISQTQIDALRERPGIAWITALKSGAIRRLAADGAIRSWRRCSEWSPMPG